LKTSALKQVLSDHCKEFNPYLTISTVFTEIKPSNTVINYFIVIITAKQALMIKHMF